MICHDGSVAATVWKGRLAFGMVSVPVRLYKAARRERVKFHHVYRSSKEPAELDEPAEDLRPFVAHDHGSPARIREFPEVASEVTPIEEIE